MQLAYDLAAAGKRLTMKGVNSEFSSWPYWARQSLSLKKGRHETKFKAH
jgi:hypothetical protein